MNNKNKTIALVINARTKSSRIKKKLIKPFNQSTLLDIALSKVNQMSFIKEKYLAVAEKILIKKAQKYKNIKVLIRSDNSIKKGVNPHEVTFAHYNNIKADFLFVFNPCLPLIKVSTIQKAIRYFKKTNYRSYTAGIKCRDWIFSDQHKGITNKNPNNLTTNKGKEFFKATHAFHIIDLKRFKKNQKHWDFKKNDPHIILMPEEEYIDIDNHRDFEFGEFLYKKLKKSM